jgi:hypothetical protein
MGPEREQRMQPDVPRKRPPHSLELVTSATANLYDQEPRRARLLLRGSSAVWSHRGRSCASSTSTRYRFEAMNEELLGLGLPRSVSGRGCPRSFLPRLLRSARRPTHLGKTDPI